MKKFFVIGNPINHSLSPELHNFWIKKYNLDNIWMETNLMCMGEKASSVLNDIKWKKIFLFNPGEEEFLLYKI